MPITFPCCNLGRCHNRSPIPRLLSGMISRSHSEATLWNNMAALSNQDVCGCDCRLEITFAKVHSSGTLAPKPQSNLKLALSLLQSANGLIQLTCFSCKSCHISGPEAEGFSLRAFEVVTLIQRQGDSFPAGNLFTTCSWESGWSVGMPLFTLRQWWRKPSKYCPVSVSGRWCSFIRW